MIILQLMLVITGISLVYTIGNIIKWRSLDGKVIKSK